MKKLLLLSALLIFACTDDDTSNEENTNPSNEKLIESVTFHSVQTCLEYSDFLSTNTTNCTYNSDNLITSFKNQRYEFDCPNDFYYYEEDSTNNIEYFDGYIIGSSDGEAAQVDLNVNGYIDTFNSTDDDVTTFSNIVYENGYISSISQINGFWDRNFFYQNGNFTRFESISDNGYTIEVVITYTTFENKSKLFHPLLGNSGFPYFALQNFYGKNNINLPLTYVRNNYYEGVLSSTQTEYYNYIFDNDGYVTFLEIGTFTDSQNQNIDNSLSEVTLEITYTN